MANGFIVRTLAGLMVLVVLAGCGGAVVQSTWPERGAAVDGDGVEWEDRLLFIENVNTAIGVRNDQDAFFVAIVPWSQQALVQVVASGCELWFEPFPEKDRRIYVRFPEGDMGVAVGMARTLSRDELLALFRDLGTRETEVTFLDDSKKRIATVPTGDAARAGVEVALGEYHGHLLIELALPREMEWDGKTYELWDPDTEGLTLHMETPTVEERERRESERALSTGFMNNTRMAPEEARQFRLPRVPINITMRVKPARVAPTDREEQ